MDPERAAKQIQSITGLIGIVGSLLAAVAAFSSQLREAVDVFASLGVAGLAVVSVLLFIVGAVLFASGRRKASRLVDPDALRLSSRNPDHLIGRGEDIQLLREKCETRPLVFLVGDSGSGKSALVQGGLILAASNDGHFLPIYIDMADLDWESGPLGGLADRFWRKLSDDERKKLNLDKPPTKDNIRSLLANCYASLGRMPLIVLDQIDDYQVRHRALLLPPQSRSWISASELIANNTFWATLADLLEKGQIHSVLVTRSDNADGLESLRFVSEPSVFRLEPLPAGFALRVIDQLTARPAGGPAVIAAAEHGWDRLRIRLADDLEQKGYVLPQQLKLALLGLARLKALSIVRYERAGGIEGLEARYIEDALSRAASRAGMAVANLREAVLRLVDRDGIRRTAPLSLTELSSTIHGSDSSRLIAGLEALEEADILYHRQAEGAPTWQLDHDYLARGLRRAEINANRWRALLIRRAREYEDARGSWRARRKARLRVREQLSLLFFRCMGKFRYGTERRFAMLCAIPPAAFAIILTLFITTVNVIIQIVRAETYTGMVSPYDAPYSLEWQSLAELSQMGKTGRLWFAIRMLNDPELASRMIAKPELIARAVVGLDKSVAAWIVKWGIAPEFGMGDLSSIRASAALLAQMPHTAQMAVPETRAFMEKKGLDDPPLEEFVVFNLAKSPIDSAINEKNAADVLAQLEAIRDKTGASIDTNRLYIAAGYKAAAHNVPMDRLSSALATIHDELRANHGRPWVIDPLARLYAALGRRLPPSGTAGVVRDLVEEIQLHRGDRDAVMVLAWAQRNATWALPIERRSEFATDLAEELRAARGDGASVVFLALAVSSTAPVLSVSRRDAATIVREEVDRSRGGVQVVTALAEAHAALTLGSPEEARSREDIFRLVLNEVADAWARGDRPPGQEFSSRAYFEPCWASECFSTFANVILDAAAAKPFNVRAELISELLKVPVAARLQQTEMLLARLRSEHGAKAAGVPNGSLWDFVEWAENNDLDPARALDQERLFEALPE